MSTNSLTLDHWRITNYFYLLIDSLHAVDPIFYLNA